MSEMKYGEKAYNLTKETFPEFNDEQIGEFLMSATAFPFADIEHLASQVKEKRSQVDNEPEAKTLKDKLNLCMAIACEELDNSMKSQLNEDNK